MPTRLLSDALHDSAAGPLLGRLALTQRICALVVEAIGPPARESGCSRPDRVEQQGSTIVLRASTTATAAKLRQTVPRLLTHLQRRGIQVTQIRVKVQPVAFPGGQDIGTLEPISVPPGRPAAAGGRDPTGPRALAEALSKALPDSPLRRAAERLRKRLDTGG